MQWDIDDGYERFCKYEKQQGREPCTKKEWEEMCIKALEKLEKIQAAWFDEETESVH